MTAHAVAYLATDVGLWMSLPAFGPALIIVGVVFFVIRRDRRRTTRTAEDEGEHRLPPAERNEN